MAHTTQIRPNIDDLIEAHGIHTSKIEHDRLTNRLLQVLAKDQSARTNQFEVRAQVDGLVEKCAILNRETLGEAIQFRLDEIYSKANKWTPEVLSFFLQLSDRPIEQTCVEDLDLLRSEPDPALLTWSDILADDPFENQSAVWRDIEYELDASDGDSLVLELASATSESEIIEAKSEEDEVQIDEFVIDVSQDSLAKILKIRKPIFNRDASKETAEAKTELEIIRNIVFMLLGLPTLAFERSNNGGINLRENVSLRNVSDGSVQQHIRGFTRIGQQLRDIRHWINTQLTVPLEQTLQSILSRKLQGFEDVLHSVQAEILDQSSPLVVSLLTLKERLLSASRYLLQLHSTCENLMDGTPVARPFRILQSLFDRTCMNQSIGDEDGYQYMAEAFLECFRTYLEPIREWMEGGDASSDKETLLVEEIAGPLSLQSVWHDHFRLVRNSQGIINAPVFLHPQVQKIFNAGKCVFLLRLLDALPPNFGSNIPEMPMTFASVCQSIDSTNLSPFSELFNLATARWIGQRHQAASDILKTHLQTDWGLEGSLDAFEYIYFYRDASLGTSVTYPLFARLESLNRKDQSPDTNPLDSLEIYRLAFENTPCIDIDRLSLQPISPSKETNPARSMASLPSQIPIQPIYTPQWPILNIIRPSTTRTYQEIYILLTQLHRAKHLLQSHSPPQFPTPLPPSSSSPILKSLTSTLYSLNHTLQTLTLLLLTHITTLVLPTSSSHLRTALKQASDISAMQALHSRHMYRTAHRCLLTPRHARIHKVLLSILDLCVVYANICLSMRERESESENNKSVGEREREREREEKLQSLSEKAKGLKRTFGHLVTILVAGVEGVRACESLDEGDEVLESGGGEAGSVDGDGNGYGNGVADEEERRVIWEILASNLRFLAMSSV